MNDRNLGGVLEDKTTPMSLIKGMQRGDEEAWQRFMDCYGEQLYIWMGKLLGPYKHQDLDNLFQDFSFRVFTKWPEVEYDKNRSFKGWLVTTAKNMWIDLVRAREAAGKMFEQGVDWSQVAARPIADELLEFNDQRESLRRKAEAIVEAIVPELKFECYQRVVLQSWTHQETADLLGTSTSSVGRYKMEVSRLVQKKALELAEQD